MLVVVVVAFVMMVVSSVMVTGPEISSDLCKVESNQLMLLHWQCR
jgi:hypothetical protein